MFYDNILINDYKFKTMQKVLKMQINKLKLITNDTFYISERIRGIDDNYRLYFNNQSKKIEVHNLSQNINTYCLTNPFEVLDYRLIDYVLKTHIKNAEKVSCEIESHNEKLKMDNEQILKTYTENRLKEIYNYSANSSKEFNCQNSFLSKYY